jgi:hypothetical protein
LLILKESAKERARFIRNADNFICRLPIEFEIELGLRSAVVPVAKRLQFTASEPPFRQCGPFDVNAHARRLPENAGFLRDHFGGDDDAQRDKTLPAFVLARKDEDRVAFGDMLAAIHRLLRLKRERLRPRIVNLSFDREHRAMTDKISERREMRAFSQPSTLNLLSQSKIAVASISIRNSGTAKAETPIQVVAGGFVEEKNSLNTILIASAFSGR